MDQRPARLTTVPAGTGRAVKVAAGGRAAGPGSEVVLAALRDVLLVVSACPQDLVPISGADAPPRQVDLYTD